MHEINRFQLFMSMIINTLQGEIKSKSVQSAHNLIHTFSIFVCSSFAFFAFNVFCFFLQQYSPSGTFIAFHMIVPYLFPFLFQLDLKEFSLHYFVSISKNKKNGHEAKQKRPGLRGFTSAQRSGVRISQVVSC
jgi:hypothetical protein